MARQRRFDPDEHYVKFIPAEPPLIMLEEWPGVDVELTEYPGIDVELTEWQGIDVEFTDGPDLLDDRQLSRRVKDAARVAFFEPVTFEVEAGRVIPVGDCSVLDIRALIAADQDLFVETYNSFVKLDQFCRDSAHRLHELEVLLRNRDPVGDEWKRKIQRAQDILGRTFVDFDTPAHAVDERDAAGRAVLAFFEGLHDDTQLLYRSLWLIGSNLPFRIVWPDLHRCVNESGDRAQFIDPEFVSHVPRLAELRPDLPAEAVDMLPWDETTWQQARTEAGTKIGKQLEIYKRLVTAGQI